MNYTVCFLYTDSGERVLMQRKNKTQYAGRLNGVGGKIEPGETPLEGARREIMEETGADIQSLIWLGTLILPRDCGLPVDQDNVDCELNFFAGTVESSEIVSQQPGETEPLLWLLTRQVIGGHADLAGDGEVEYFVSKGFRAVTARTSVLAENKKLGLALTERCQAAADNLTRETKFLHSTFHFPPAVTVSAMKEATAVIREIIANGFDKHQVAQYKTVAINLSEEAETFEWRVIKGCTERYVFSRTVSAMEEAAAVIQEVIKLNI